MSRDEDYEDLSTWSDHNWDTREVSPSRHVGPRNEKLSSSGDIYRVLCTDYERHAGAHVASRREGRCRIVGGDERSLGETVEGGVAIGALIGCMHPRIGGGDSDKGKEREHSVAHADDHCQLCQWQPLIQRARDSDNPRNVIEAEGVSVPFIDVYKHLSEVDELMRWRCYNVLEAETCVTYFNMRLEQKRAHKMYLWFYDNYNNIRLAADECKEVFWDYHERHLKQNRTLEYQKAMSKAGVDARTTSGNFYCAHIYAPKHLASCGDKRPYIHTIDLFAPRPNDLAKYQVHTLDVNRRFVATLIGASHLRSKNREDAKRRSEMSRDLRSTFISIVDSGRSIKERTRPLSAAPTNGAPPTSPRGNPEDPRVKRNHNAERRPDLVKAYNATRPKLYLLSNMPELEARTDYIIRKPESPYCNVLEIMTPEHYHNNVTF